MDRVQAYVLKRNREKLRDYIFYEEIISSKKRLTNINRITTYFNRKTIPL